jgi:hypothetical protein
MFAKDRMVSRVEVCGAFWGLFVLMGCVFICGVLSVDGFRLGGRNDKKRGVWNDKKKEGVRMV